MIFYQPKFDAIVPEKSEIVLNDKIHSLNYEILDPDYSIQNMRALLINQTLSKSSKYQIMIRESIEFDSY